MSLSILIGKIALTAMGLLIVVAGLGYLAHRRQRRVPASVFFGSALTFVLATTVLIFGGGFASGLPARMVTWVEVATYLGASFLMLKLVDILFIGDYLVDRKGTYIPDVVRTIILATGLIAAGLVILRLVVKINVIALVALPTIATAVVGVALKDTLERFFAGIALGKMIRVGDWVSVLEREGFVTDIGFNHVTLLTREHDHVALPNNNVIQAGIINYSRPDTIHMCSVYVEATYRIPPYEVSAVLVEAASSVKGVLPDPKPVATLKAFNESGVSYRVEFPISDYAQYQEIESEVRAYVWNAFHRHSIEIPYPQRVVHRTPSDEQSETREWEPTQVVGRLAAVDFFALLSSEQIETVAQDTRILQFLPGERVVCQGDAGEELYVILKGSAEVRLQHEGSSTVLAALQEGQFFGEMSLLTGAPRSATVVAVVPLTVIVVGKQALSRVIQEDRRLIERISEVVASRQAATLVAKDKLSRDSAGAVARETRSLVERIRSFFWGPVSG
ncbi:MAG: cyclic nucleotide-binding domain-containing protein [Nitrospiraceae bacterium]